jgi:hypothetical protein
MPPRVRTDLRENSVFDVTVGLAWPDPRRARAARASSPRTPRAARDLRNRHRMKRTDTRSLAREIPRASKRATGMSRIEKTPLDLRVVGLSVAPKLRARIPSLLGRKLERYALNVTRVTVRFLDVNGPRGGVDSVCRIKVSAKGRDHIVVEARDVDAERAFRRAATLAQTALARALDRKGPQKRRPLASRAQTPMPPSRKVAAKRPPRGSLIGRRVGRARKNLEEVLAWTGEGSTAARNVKRRTSGMTSTLEDSAKDRPSRKSTRKSENRQKSGSKIGRRTKREHHAPRARATRG